MNMLSFTFLLWWVRESVARNGGADHLKCQILSSPVFVRVDKIWYGFVELVEGAGPSVDHEYG